MTLPMLALVHGVACCPVHGCALGYVQRENCPVTAGIIEAHPCERCTRERDVRRTELQRVITAVPSGVELIRSDNLCEEWNVTTQISAIPLVFYATGAVVINTAPYTADVIAWINAKMQLIELNRDN